MTKTLLLSLFILSSPIACNHPASNQRASNDPSPATPPSLDPQTLPTPDDLQILQAVLADFSTNPEHPTFANKNKTVILLNDQTSFANPTARPGYEFSWLSDGQIQGELARADFKAEPHLLASLRARNTAPVSLSAVAHDYPAIQLISFQNSALKDRFIRFKDVYPHAKAHASAYLPGYSQDGQHAIVRFHFGPSPHGAIATYLLKKENNAWKITGRNFAYFV